MKKFLSIFVIVLIIGFAGFYSFAYFITFSEGERAGKLVKISRKGVVFKTYEGILSQGDSDQQIFYFSVLDNQKEAIENLKKLQGQMVKLSYVERFRTFRWWGDERYFVNNVQALNNDISIKEEPNKENEASLLLLEKENEMLKQRIKDLETTINILKSSSE